MSDVARLAGVSLGTVSNVLNSPRIVAPHTREKVEAAIERLGFVRNGAARSLAAGTSSTLGFVVVDLSNSFFLDMARGAQGAAAEAGMSLLLGNADMSIDQQRTYLELFHEERVAGILLAPSHGSLTTASPVRAHGRPVVVLNDRALGHDVCTVTTDNVHGGYLAARHLIELGRRRLLFAGADEYAPVRDRVTGAERAVHETNGAVALERLHTDEVRVQDGRHVGRVLIERPERERPDGLIAAADLLALGVVQVLLLESSISIPDDLAIIGYDNNRAAWESVVPISTLAQPGERMGRTATELLLEELRDPSHHHHRHVALEPELVERASTLGRHTVVGL